MCECKLDVEAMRWNVERQCYDVAVVGEEVISIIPMIFNHRVVTGPANDRTGYSHGWCYPDLISAVAAVAVWNPTTESAPVGYLKQATPGQRQPSCPLHQSGSTLRRN